MRKINLSFLVLVMVSFSLFFVGCSNQDTVNSDEVGVMRTPSDRLVQFLSHMDNWVAEQSDEISPEAFEAEIYLAWPRIDLDILNDFRSRRVIGQEELVQLEYHYFKKGRCDMQDSRGMFIPVHLTGNNKFVVRVIRGNAEDLWISLACSNGMLNIQRASDVHILARMEFTIEKGKGLSYYLHNNYWSVQVAEAFGLHMYEGHGYRNRITYDRARELAELSDIIQTTVKVRPGWKFILDEHMQIWINGDWMTPAQFRAKYVDPYR